VLTHSASWPAMTVPKQRRPETGAADSGFDYSLEGPVSTPFRSAALQDVDTGLRPA
jgi:hypothetical protein